MHTHDSLVRTSGDSLPIKNEEQQHSLEVKKHEGGSSRSLTIQQFSGPGVSGAPPSCLVRFGSLPCCSSLANPRIDDSRNSSQADENEHRSCSHAVTRPDSPTRLEGCYDKGVRGCREIASLSLFELVRWYHAHKLRALTG